MSAEASFAEDDAVRSGELGQRYAARKEQESKDLTERFGFPVSIEVKAGKPD